MIPQHKDTVLDSVFQEDSNGLDKKIMSELLLVRTRFISKALKCNFLSTNI